MDLSFRSSVHTNRLYKHTQHTNIHTYDGVTIVKGDSLGRIIGSIRAIHMQLKALAGLLYVLIWQIVVYHIHVYFAV